MQSGSITPIFRIFDIALAQSFYIDYLGFQLDWQHQFRSLFVLAKSSIFRFIYKYLKTIASFIYRNISAMRVHIAQFEFIGKIFHSYMPNWMPKILSLPSHKLKRPIGKL